MKFFYYTWYFLYIAWNWNFRLAYFTIYHEIAGERKYHLNTTRLNDLQKLTITGGNLQHAEVYQAANYYLLEDLFRALKKLDASDGFVDFGCGRGRVMVVAAHHGFTSISGVDFAKELCEEAQSNCDQIKQKFSSASFHVIYLNAVDFIIEKNMHVLFFFNPFKEVVMKKVIKNIKSSLKGNPRKLFVVYMNPQHKRLFLQDGFREVYYIRKMQFVEACILENK